MALFIERESISGLRETFINNTKNLVFRRVHRVVLKDHDFVGTSIKKVEDGTIKETFVAEDKEKVIWTEDEWLKNVELRYTKFHFFTSQARLRENDRTRTTIYGASNRISEMDLFDECDFRLKLQTKKGWVAPPRVGDLVCGVVGQNRNQRNPEYKFWFVCSEQFFRTWTALHYEEHESLSKKCGNGEAQIKRHLMSGNRLCTNGALKLVLGAMQSNVGLDRTEFAKKFFRVRTEDASRYWVHIYAFLVMAIRYLEYPTDANVPNNLDDTPKMTKWNLPDYEEGKESWVEKLFAKYGVCKTEKGPSELSEQPREVKVSVVVENKGEGLNARLIKELTSSSEVFTRELKEEKKETVHAKISSEESDFPYLPRKLPENLRKSSPSLSSSDSVLEKIKNKAVVIFGNPIKFVDMIDPLNDEEKGVLGDFESLYRPYNDTYEYSVRVSFDQETKTYGIVFRRVYEFDAETDEMCLTRSATNFPRRLLREVEKHYQEVRE